MAYGDFLSKDWPSGPTTQYGDFLFRDWPPVNIIPPEANIQFVQGSGSGSSSSDDFLTTTITNAITGNSIIVCVSNYNASVGVDSVIDTQGNTYNICGPVSGGDGNHRTSVYLASNIIGASTLDITINFTGNTGFRHMTVSEFSGLGEYDTAGTAKLESGGSVTHTTNNVTPSQANALIYGFFVSWSAVYGFIETAPSTLFAISGTGVASCGRIVSESGTYNANVNTDNSNEIFSIIRCFKPS